MENTLFSLFAVAAMLPATYFSLSRNDGRRGEDGRNDKFWLTLAVAITGPMVLVLANLSGAWQTGFSMAL